MRRVLLLHVYTQSLLKTKGADEDCSLGGAFDRKFDERVGYLNTTLARGGVNLSDSNFNSSSARALPRMRRNIICFNCEELEHMTDSSSEEVNCCIYRVPGHIIVEAYFMIFSPIFA